MALNGDFLKWYPKIDGWENLRIKMDDLGVRLFRKPPNGGFNWNILEPIYGNLKSHQKEGFRQAH